MTLVYNTHNSNDNSLDLGRQLKNEKKVRENQEHIEKIKKEAEESGKEDQNKAQKKKDPKTAQSSKTAVAFYLLIIILLAISIRIYVASMPVTDSWAEMVVFENLKNKVTRLISEQYPTLSEEKKQELIVQGTLEALNAQQNKEAIETLSASYKESYKDPESNSYLYEIDPYYFYEIAQNEESYLNIPARNLFAFIERWFHNLVLFIFPNISFAKAIFYLPLLFTILCAVVLFFMGKEIWNETAGFIAGLFFVSHPVLLEFSLLGFVDTNMLNIFFILASGLLFLYAIKLVRTEEQTMKKYASLILLVVFIIILVILFMYNWSAWYVGVGLILVPLGVLSFLSFKDFILSWKTQAARRKKIFMAAITLILIISVGFFSYWFGKEEGSTVTRIEQKFLTPTLKKYLHLEYENPYGVWPDAFSLIKELQTTSISDFSKYLGGKIPVLISFIALLYVLYYGAINKEIKLVYLGVAVLIFMVLSFRAIRILPYFIPFFAILFGIGMSSAFVYVTKKAEIFFNTQSKVMDRIIFVIILCIFILPVAYSFVLDTKEKSAIMPIMDDAIYNSAIFIKEQSDETAKVSTWWDRGTFYKALAEREVHLHSQPHMPTTYWLSSFYMAEDEIQAKNVILMINNRQDGAFLDIFKQYLPKHKAIVLLKEILKIERERTNFKEQLSSLNYAWGSFPNGTVQDEVYSTIEYQLSDQEHSETYIVLIDDLMPRFSAVQYFAQWNFETGQPDQEYPYTDIEEYGCLRSSSGVYCTVQDRNVYVNFTSLDFASQIPIHEVYVVENNTVQYMQQNTTATTATSGQQWTLITYNRAGYWKAVYLPKQVAESMYVRLMLLDGYNLAYFEKVFDEVHVETSRVKVYKVNWNGTT